jgi:hypothetical protein
LFGEVGIEYQVELLNEYSVNGEIVEIVPQPPANVDIVLSFPPNHFLSERCSKG